ncbi:glycosyltransferase family 4 protein [Halopseudomonas bauzanensis]|uniref:glycosyltransferase family 4 protein n=1 Tax=Halopseudomonas bauzanensis TaxID=653930 RepID=UPI002556FCF8|nr:glycosyltransferase family 4 protein [Halopseudomonas bauzanensis]
MRVLHLFKTYQPDSMGGIEQTIFQLCEACKPWGVESSVLTLSRQPAAQPLRIANHQVHQAKLDVNLASTGLSREVFQHFRHLAQEADIVHYHFPWPLMDLLHFNARHGKPSVLSYHSDIVRQRFLLQLYRPLMHRFLGAMDQIVTASPNYLATSDILARYRHKTQVIPYGLDKTGYNNIDPPRLAHWQTQFPDGFFLFVGVMRYYKGLHILLDACKDTHYPVLIVGAGPMEKRLRRQADQLQLQNVHFVGPLPDAEKNALLQACRVLVFPSHLRSEAFGISLLEGAMFGKPMISSEIGTGTTYINIHGETGLVVPPSDAAALRGAMQHLWNDRLLSTRMGQAAAQRYQSLFTAERMGQSFSTIYQRLAGAPKLSLQTQYQTERPISEREL